MATYYCESCNGPLGSHIAEEAGHILDRLEHAYLVAQVRRRRRRVYNCSDGLLDELACCRRQGAVGRIDQGRLCYYATTGAQQISQGAGLCVQTGKDHEQVGRRRKECGRIGERAR